MLDVVLGVSMAPTAVRIALVEGEDAEGVIVEEDSFHLTRDPAALSGSDQVIAAILGTREGAAEAGLRLSSVGVTWTDQLQAAALRDALAARKVENVMLVSAFLAAAALGQAVGSAVGYERTGVLLIEPDSATLAVVNTADGSLCDVRRQQLADDDDTAVAELAEMVSDAETMDARPDGIYVVGSGVDVPLIKPALDAATTLTVSVSEEPDMALARGAALASGQSPLFAATTAAFAYAQDPADSDEDSEGEVADAESDDVDESGKRRPALLVGSALAVVAVAAAIALEVALAISIRPTVALQPTPSQNHFLALVPKAPAPIEVAAPQPKLNLPGPAVAPRVVAPPQLPERAPAAPVLPAPEVPAPALPAPRLPEPVVVPPLIPVVVPPIQAPGPDSLLRPPVAQVPVQVPRQQPQLPAPRAPVASPPRVSNPAPQAPVIQSPPGLGPAPNPGRGRGPGGGIPGGGGPGGPGGQGPGGRGPFGGGPVGGDGPFGGGGPGAHGPFGGGPGGHGGPGGPGGPGGGGGPGGHGPFGGNGPGGGGGGGGGGRGPFGGGGPGFGGGGHGPFGGGGPGGGGPGGGGHGGGGFGGGGGGHGRR